MSEKPTPYQASKVLADNKAEDANVQKMSITMPMDLKQRKETFTDLIKDRLSSLGYIDVVDLELYSDGKPLTNLSIHAVIEVTP
jgi:hypothetical protein